MFEQQHNRVLREAARRFPEGCLCEDCGVCCYCRFILSSLDEWNMNCTSLDEELDGGALPDNLEFKIPVGLLGQIYELRRVFRLCI